VLALDSDVFAAPLFALLHENRNERFVAGYVQQSGGEELFRGLIVIARTALRRIVHHQVVLGCVLALEDSDYVVTHWTIDRYVACCATRFAYGPRVPFVDLHSLGARPCANNSSSARCPVITLIHVHRELRGDLDLDLEVI
jgi:hypothetical protein